MTPAWRFHCDPASSSLKENLVTDTTFDPITVVSWDSALISLCFLSFALQYVTDVCTVLYICISLHCFFSWLCQLIYFLCNQAEAAQYILYIGNITPPSPPPPRSGELLAKINWGENVKRGRGKEWKFERKRRKGKGKLDWKKDILHAKGE